MDFVEALNVDQQVADEAEERFRFGQSTDGQFQIHQTARRFQVTADSGELIGEADWMLVERHAVGGRFCQVPNGHWPGNSRGKGRELLWVRRAFFPWLRWQPIGDRHAFESQTLRTRDGNTDHGRVAEVIVDDQVDGRSARLSGNSGGGKILDPNAWVE